MRRHRLLASMTAVMMLAGVGAAAADPPEPAPTSWLSGSTLTCSAAAPSVTLGCYMERRVATLGPVEFAIGVDAQTVLTDLDASHLAPMFSVAWYGESTSAWLEVRMPNLGIPVLGDSDWLRLGFSLTLP